MKHTLLLACIGALFLLGCKTTGEADLAAANLSYPDEPTVQKMIEMAEPIIRYTLKDPDSLKLLKLTRHFKCYISKEEFTDNVSPKYPNGHWCAEFSYRATNSYGAFVPGEAALIYLDGTAQMLPIIPTVRETGNVWNWYSVHNM